MTNSEKKSTEIGGEYSSLAEDLRFHRDRILALPDRYQPITSRKNTCVFDLPQMKAIARAKYLSLYKGYPLLKTTLDISLYTQMFQELKPKSIIEFGTYIGSSALWMDDTLRLFGIDCKIFTMDKYVSLRDKSIDKLVSKQVTFIEGDSNNIEELFPPSFFKDLPRPLFIIEDAHQNVDGILRYFHKFMNIGDYFIIEDTNPLINRHIYVGDEDPSIYCETSMVKHEYVQDGDWKLKIVRNFFSDEVDAYAVDTFFNDLLGNNGCLQMNSILRKMK